MKKSDVIFGIAQEGKDENARQVLMYSNLESVAEEVIGAMCVHDKFSDVVTSAAMHYVAALWDPIRILGYLSKINQYDQEGLESIRKYYGENHPDEAQAEAMKLVMDMEKMMNNKGPRS